MVHGIAYDVQSQLAHAIYCLTGKYPKDMLTSCPC